jgi:uncharacterized protein (DUF1499 family)
MLTAIKIVLVLFGLALAMPVGGLLLNRPPLFDPPGPGERLRIYLRTNVAELTDQPLLPELRARDFNRDPDAVYNDVLRAVERLGWNIEMRDEATREVHAVVTTALWRFKDDVRIRIDARPDGGSRVYARSQSRVGRGDLGANARHLRELVTTLERRE